MSFNGSGTFVINTAGQPVVSGTVISSTAFNALTADLATGLSTCITKDGQTTPTANIPMGNNKITNLAVGTAATDAANLSQVQSTTAKLVNSISGADTITGTMSPNLAAYATGQMFYFIAAGDNTGAVTLNIDSLGAKAVTRDGSVALAAGDIKSGEVVVVVYDGTRFQVVSQINSSGNATFANVSITSALNVGGVATVTGGATLNGGVVINEPGADADTRIEGDTDANLVFVDASTDRVGVGTSSPASKLHVVGEARVYTGSNLGYWGVDAGNSYVYFGSNSSGYSLSFQTAGSERARITSGGDFGIGTTSPQAYTNYTVLTVDNATNGGVVSVRRNGNALLNLYTGSGEGRVEAANSAFLSFYTTSAERARITAGGYSKFSDNGVYLGSTGSYHEFRQSTDNANLQITSVNANLTNPTLTLRASRNTTNGSFYYLDCYNDGSGTYRLRVADSGNVTNVNGSYGTISDAKMKTDIVDAGSQWDDLKAVRFRKFKMKDDPSGLMQLGVVAQELEQTSPGLVDQHADRDADGNDLGTTTKSVKTSVLLMKAAVALQEAMTRIEQLEAKVAALEAK